MPSKEMIHQELNDSIDRVVSIAKRYNAPEDLDPEGFHQQHDFDMVLINNHLEYIFMLVDDDQKYCAIRDLIKEQIDGNGAMLISSAELLNSDCQENRGLAVSKCREMDLRSQFIEDLLGKMQTPAYNRRNLEDDLCLLNINSTRIFKLYSDHDSVRRYFDTRFREETDRAILASACKELRR